MPLASSRAPLGAGLLAALAERALAFFDRYDYLVAPSAQAATQLLPDQADPASRG